MILVTTLFQTRNMTEMTSANNSEMCSIKTHECNTYRERQVEAGVDAKELSTPIVTAKYPNAWKSKAFCPCIVRSGTRANLVCNAKVYLGDGKGDMCYIHRNVKNIIRVDQLPAPAAAAPPAPKPNPPLEDSKT